MSDTALLDAVTEEVTEIRTVNKLTPEQPTSYTQSAWNGRGIAD
jgi:hypothetical protein